MKPVILFLYMGAILFSSVAGSQWEPQNIIPEMEEFAMSNEALIVQNQKFLMERLGTPEYGTKGTASLLVEVGCGAIKEIICVDDSGKAYTVTVEDDAGNQYLFTMGYDGYPGYIKDGDGNFLYAPID